MCVLKQQIAFCEELISIQAVYKERLREEELYPKPDQHQAMERIKNGQPLIDIEEIRVKEETIKDILDDVCNALIKHELCGKEEIGQLRIADFESLMIAAFSYDEDIDALNMFIVTNAIKIILNIVADRFRDSIDDSQWLHGYCPMCGALPLMARLQKEDGKRLLHCSMCSAQWPFVRIKCIYCGTEDQNDLRFFWADDSSPYRVDVCDECKGYIKTVDERKIQGDMELNHFIEDINTAYLDILAAEEGYHGQERVV